MTQAKQDPAAYAQTPAFEAGRQVRSEVMGEQYVQRAFDAAQQQGDVGLQQLVTEFAWGTVWTREGLDRKQRSLATVSMLIALNRPQELRELVVHSAVYCGFPAALDAGRKLAEVLEAANVKG
ncbi:carboxymuconolactone decarboxylase family protein [Cupriavidus sp. 8B]